jgi:hypothetical protein
MSLTIDEIGELLKIAQRYDKRSIAEGDIEAWYAALNLRNLDFRPCAEAIVRHYAYTDDFVKPSHVAELAKSRPEDKPVPALGPGTPRASDWRRQLSALLPTPEAAVAGGHPRGHPALAVRCTWCSARPTTWCSKIVKFPPPRPVAGFLHPSRVDSVKGEAA